MEHVQVVQSTQEFSLVKKSVALINADIDSWMNSKLINNKY